MGDAENTLPPSKKRAAGRELSRDNPGLDDEESPEQETGTFKKASDDVLAGRRIVKVRRNQTTSAPSSNPFAGIQLVPPTQSKVIAVEAKADTQSAADEPVPAEGDIKRDGNEITERGKDEQEKESGSTVKDIVADSAAVDKEDVVEKKTDVVEKETDNGEVVKPEVYDQQAGGGGVEKSTDNGEVVKPEINDAVGGDENGKDAKDDNQSEKADSGVATTPVNSFQQLSSSQNAFTGLAGTGFSSSTFSFGTISKDGAAGSGSSSSTFSFGVAGNGNSSLFGTPGASVVSKSVGSAIPPMEEVPVETGEENEKAVFTADSVMFEFNDGGWKERGKGELKVNVSTSGAERARLVMRARGNYRLILNASLYPDMKLTNMEKKGITFACVNCTGEGKDILTTFALKFRDPSIVEEFRAAVTAHKGGRAAVPLKTPENSPKATDD